MGESTVLLVTPTQAENNMDFDISFNVHDNLSQISEKEMEQTYKNLLNADSINVSGYNVLNPHLQMFAVGSSSYIQAVLIHKRAVDIIQKVKPDFVYISEKLDAEFKLAVIDAINSEDICHNEVSVNSGQRRMYTSYIRTLIFIIEHFIFAIIPCLDKEIDVISVKKEKAKMQPVIGRIESDEQTSHRGLTLSLAKLIKRGRLSSRVLTRHTTWRVLYDELIFYASFIYILHSGKLAKSVTQQFRDQTGAHMPATTSYVLRQILFDNRIEAYTYMFAMEAAIEQTDCEKVIVGSMGPKHRAIVQTARKYDVKPFHIPHSIATPYYSTYEGMTHFVSGEMDMKFLREFGYSDIKSEFLPYGRPYLYDLYHKLSGKELAEDETEQGPCKVLIATQPFENKFEFMEVVIAALESVEIQFNIIIKTHPTESTSTYEHYYQDNDDVQVTDKNLFKRIECADLVITQNSNVGLESIITGTACLTVNLDSLSRRRMPYMMYDEVPVLTSRRELERYLSETNRGAFYQLGEKQQSVLTSDLQITRSPAKKIAMEILSA